MTKIVLHDFDKKGLGEGIRMLLAYVQQEFEDHRVNKEEWTDFKSKTPFGQLPLLEIDGKMYSKSNAIYRYLGRKYGLAGDDLEQELEIDQNVDLFTELREEAASVFYEPDEQLRKVRQEAAEKNEFLHLLTHFEDIVKKNNGYIALGKLTWGDFLIAGMHEGLRILLQMPDLYEKYPNLKRIYENVTSIPTVKDYVDSL